MDCRLEAIKSVRERYHLGDSEGFNWAKLLVWLWLEHTGRG